MKEIIRIDGKKYAGARKEPYGMSYLAPNDVPREMRITHQKGTRTLVLAFEYIGDEAVKVRPFGRSVLITMGKYSQRMCGMVIDVYNLTPENRRKNALKVAGYAMEIMVHEADMAQDEMSRRRLKTHYEMIRELLKDNSYGQ